MAEAITLEQLQAALKPVTDQLAQIKPLQDQVTALTTNFKSVADNQKVMADTLAALPPASKEKKEEKKEEAKSLGADDVTRIVSEAIKADRTAQAQASASSEKKTAARNKVIAAKGLNDLDPLLLAGLPDSEDEAALTAAADKIVAAANKAGIKLADVGGVKKDGGETKGEKKDVPKPVGSGMSDGQQKLASAIVLPGQAA